MLNITRGRAVHAGGARSNGGFLTPADRFDQQNNKVNLVSRASCTGAALCVLFSIVTLRSAAQVVADSGQGASRYAISVQQLRVRPDVRGHLIQAQKQFSKIMLPEAIKEIDRALRLDPGCAQAFVMRALIRLAANDAGRAVEDASRATTLDPNDAESFLALGTAYNSTRNFHEAETAARQALRLRPDLWQAQLEVAKALYGQEQFLRALHELDALKTEFPDVHLVRGNVLMRLGRSWEAAGQFSLFLTQVPNDPRGERIKQIVTTARRTSGDTDPSQN